MRLEIHGGEGTVVPLAPRRREPPKGWVVAAIGAAAAVVVAVLGVQVVRQQGRLDDMQSDLEQTTLASAANQAFDDPDAVEGAAPVLRRRGHRTRRWCSPTAAGS